MQQNEVALIFTRLTSDTTGMGSYVKKKYWHKTLSTDPHK